MAGYYAVTNGELTDEIKKMVEGKTMDIDEAMRLLLVIVSRIQRDVSKMEEAMQRIEKLEQYNERYPSIYYVWRNNKREIITIIIIVLILYTIVVSPWMISDMRHALLHMLGLPTDLGITTPP